MKLKTNCLFYHHDGMCLYTGKDFDCEHCEFYAISPTIVRQKIEGLKKDLKDMFDTATEIKDTIWYDEYTTLFDEIIFRIDKWFEDVI